MIVSLGGAVIASLGLAGSRTQMVGAVVLLALCVGQSAIQRPVVPPPSAQWTAALRTPLDRVRHTISPPADSAEWRRWWRSASNAAVYVCARGPLTPADGLELFADGQWLARITQSDAIGPRPQPTSVGFYRIPIDRTRLETRAPVTFELRRVSDATDRPIEICGTFSYRPTAGLRSSELFDGTTWSSPGPSMTGRYVIELRLEQGPGRAVAALY